MGSPIVFQTTPPQPASKARITCSPQLVGGADASQKGFTHRMPAKVVSSVGILSLQPCRDADTRALAVGDGVDYFAASVGAVAAGEVFGVRSLSGGAVDYDAASFQLDLVFEERFRMRRLSYGEDYQIDLPLEIFFRLRYERAVCRCLER